MSFDYNPNIENLTGIKTFRFWCQKTLPLVYDDSLSYYELLCKVVDYINKLIEDTSKLGENDTALLEAYNKLKEFVNEETDRQNEHIDTEIDRIETFVTDYFNSLDVDTKIAVEINNKLQEMYDNGDFDEITDSLVNASPVLNVKLLGINPENSGEDNFSTLDNYFRYNITAKTLYFPSGTYNFSQSINVPSNISIVGDGYTSIIKRIKKHENEANDTSGVIAIYGDNITIKDINIQVDTSIDRVGYTNEIINALDNDEIELCGIFISSNNYSSSNIIEERKNINITNVYCNDKIGIFINCNEKIKNLVVDKFYNEWGYIYIKSAIRNSDITFSNIDVCGFYSQKFTTYLALKIINSNLKNINIYSANSIIDKCTVKMFSSSDNSEHRLINGYNTFNTESCIAIQSGNIINTHIVGALVNDVAVKCYVSELLPTDKNATILTNSKIDSVPTLWKTSTITVEETGGTYEIKSLFYSINNITDASVQIPSQSFNLDLNNNVSTVDVSEYGSDAITNLFKSIDYNNYYINIILKINSEPTDINGINLGKFNFGTNVSSGRNFFGVCPCTISYRTLNGDKVSRPAVLDVSYGNVSIKQFSTLYPPFPDTTDGSGIFIQANGLLYLM